MWTNRERKPIRFRFFAVAPCADIAAAVCSMACSAACYSRPASHRCYLVVADRRKIPPRCRRGVLSLSWRSCYATACRPSSSIINHQSPPHSSVHQNYPDIPPATSSPATLLRHCKHPVQFFLRRKRELLHHPMHLVAVDSAGALTAAPFMCLANVPEPLFEVLLQVMSTS